MSSPRDPLFDTLFRPTTVSPAIASAAPVREAGTRSRAGNAMNRTRAYSYYYYFATLTGRSWRTR